MAPGKSKKSNSSTKGTKRKVKAAAQRQREAGAKFFEWHARCLSALKLQTANSSASSWKAVAETGFATCGWNPPYSRNGTCADSPVELHSHTHLSDGTLSPEELVERAARRGVRALAITDHDTLEGVSKAMEVGAREGVAIIPGVEISAYLEPRREEGAATQPGLTLDQRAPLSVHILGYFAPEAPSWQGTPGGQAGALEQCLAGLRHARHGRLRLILEQLRTKGLTLLLDDVLREVGPSVAPGRPHIARLLVRQGAAVDQRDAFARFLDDTVAPVGSGAEVEAGLAIELIRRAGGAAVLAHPWSVRGLTPLQLLSQVAAAGAVGVEVRRGSTLMTEYDGVAAQLGLLRVGGSDFHGSGGKGEIDLGGCRVDLRQFLLLMGHCSRAGRDEDGGVDPGRRVGAAEAQSALA